jgi:pimeloyl-ACP methyl ester carboxylesterase
MIEAVIQTATSEVAYRRAGRGPHVLLLTDGADDDRLRDALFSSLAEHFRVIAPVPAHADPALLRDIIDGLGLERPSIVADEASGIAALAFALLDPERVDRVVVVRHRRAGPARQPHVDDTLTLSGHPLFLLQLATAEPDVLPEVARALLVRCLASSA